MSPDTILAMVNPAPAPSHKQATSPSWFLTALKGQGDRAIVSRSFLSSGTEFHAFSIFVWERHWQSQQNLTGTVVPPPGSIVHRSTGSPPACDKGTPCILPIRLPDLLPTLMCDRSIPVRDV